MVGELRSKMVDWPRGEVLEVRRGGAEVLEVMLADAATLGLSGGFVARADDGATGVLALAAGAPIGALIQDDDGTVVGEVALAPFREMLRSGTTEVEVHHLPGSLVQEALAVHVGSRFSNHIEHDDVRWWEGRIPAPRRARAPRLPTMAPTVRAPEGIRASVDRTRARIRVDHVDLSPASVRLVHASTPEALTAMSRAWAAAGGCSVMIARRGEEVPEGVHHLWIHEGALNLPEAALDDRPMLIVSVDVHLLSVVMGPEVAASSFADLLDHGREHGAVHLIHIAEEVLTTAELTRFTHYGASLDVEDVAALASDERSLRALSGFDADAVAQTRLRFAPGIDDDVDDHVEDIETVEVSVVEPEPEMDDEPEAEVESEVESVVEPTPVIPRKPRRAQRVRARKPAPHRATRVPKFQPPMGEPRDAEWPAEGHGGDATADLVRNAPESAASLPVAPSPKPLGLAKVRNLPAMAEKANRPPLARPESWPEVPSSDAMKRRQAWDSLRLARRFAPEPSTVEVPDVKGLQKAAVRPQQAFDVDGAHARLFTPQPDAPTGAATVEAPRRRKRSSRKTRRLGGDGDA